MEDYKMSKEEYKERTIETINKIDDIKKEELLCKVVAMFEVLPVSECQRTYDYLSELYFS